MSTFDLLIDELTRDIRRVQPNDALQYCANWFNDRLKEQRSLIRDKLASVSLPPELPIHIIQDQMSSNYPSFSSTTRPSIPGTSQHSAIRHS